jgi:hypothetical protein
MEQGQIDRLMDPPEYFVTANRNPIAFRAPIESMTVTRQSAPAEPAVN